MSARVRPTVAAAEPGAAAPTANQKIMSARVRPTVAAAEPGAAAPTANQRIDEAYE